MKLELINFMHRKMVLVGLPQLQLQEQMGFNTSMMITRLLTDQRLRQETLILLGEAILMLVVVNMMMLRPQQELAH